jgi:hypothetical protein
LTREVAPAYVTRFMQGGAGAVRQREEVQRILDAAQAGESAASYREILADLFQE